MQSSRSLVKHGNKLPEKLTGRSLSKLYNFFIDGYNEYFRNYTTLFFKAYVNINANIRLMRAKIIQLFYFFTINQTIE